MRGLIERLRKAANLCEPSAKPLRSLLTESAAALEAAREELRKDAERYRWLRECDAGNINFFFGNYDGVRGEELDAAIDAAMEDEQ